MANVLKPNVISGRDGFAPSPFQPHQHPDIGGGGGGGNNKKQKENEQPRSCRSQTGELILCMYNAEYR